MTRTVVIRGHVISPTTIEVEEPINDPSAEIEVVVRTKTPDDELSVGEYLRRLPPGNRSKEDIDRQIREERDSWRD